MEREQAPIVVKDLRKTFGQQKVLNGVNLEVRRGETVAVLGRSGTGKSVLLKLIVGLQSPDAGSVQIHGESITNLEQRRLNEIRKKIGFLFQQAALYDSLSVEENVAFPLERHTEMPDAERKGRARELLANLGMEKDLEKLPSELSGGMQKRVGLARALALDPDVLRFDEPTAGLDPITAAEIGKLIVQQNEQRRMTGVVVTHDIRGAKVFADRLVLLNDGKFVAEGTYAELQKSREEFVAQFFSEGS